MNTENPKKLNLFRYIRCEITDRRESFNSRTVQATLTISAEHECDERKLQDKSFVNHTYAELRRSIAAKLFGEIGVELQRLRYDVRQCERLSYQEMSEINAKIDSILAMLEP